MANDPYPYAFNLYDLNGGAREFRFATKREMAQAIKCLRGNGGDRAFTDKNGQHAVMPDGRLLSSVGAAKRLLFTQAELEEEAAQESAQADSRESVPAPVSLPAPTGMHTGANPVKVGKPEGMSGPLGAAR